jgi:intracellular septation protein
MSSSPVESGQAETPRRRLNPALKQGLEIGPVLVFFGVVLSYGIMPATAVLMVLFTISVAIVYAVERRVQPLLLFGLGAVLVFGGLTLILRDDFFIKVRATVYFGVLAVFLAAGLAFGRYMLRYVFEVAFRLDDAGWRILTIRTIAFFVLLAVANAVMFTQFSTEVWSAYKVFGQYPLMVLFFVAQAPLVMKHQLPEEPDATAGQPRM